MPLILGHHVYTKYGFTTCAKYVKENNGNIFQIFLRPPQSFINKEINKDDIKTLKKSAESLDIKIVIHGSFLINLCKNKEDEVLKKSMNVLITDLNTSVDLGAIGVIIHMGHNTSNITDKEAFNNYVKNLEYVLENSNKKSIIILETGAGQGHEIATNLEELGDIRTSISEKYRDRVKFCLDTCHMFAAGYHIGDEPFVNLLDIFIDSTLGWKNVVVVHLNDSKTCVYSRKDRHADITKGYIKKEGMKRFIELCIQKSIPMVLETPTDEHDGKRFTSKKQIEMIRKWFK